MSTAPEGADEVTFALDAGSTRKQLMQPARSLAALAGLLGAAHSRFVEKTASAAVQAVTWAGDGDHAGACGAAFLQWRARVLQARRRAPMLVTVPPTQQLR